MTGPEHYRKAEQLLSKGEGDPTEQGASNVAAAHTHTVLALVSVTVQNADLDVPEWTEWHRAINKRGGRL